MALAQMIQDYGRETLVQHPRLKITSGKGAVAYSLRYVSVFCNEATPRKEAFLEFNFRLGCRKTDTPGSQGQSGQVGRLLRPRAHPSYA